jgi:hypothetical protein
MSHDYRPSGSAFPGFVIRLAIAALIVTLVSVRQPPQATRVWVPVSTGASNSIQNVGCAPWCRAIDPT